MIDRLKQIWGEASWGYRILILLFLPLVIVLVLMSLRKTPPITLSKPRKNRRNSKSHGKSKNRP